MTKPPYRVPSMAEVADVPWNGFTVVSTFAGCGGSSLGYRMAGFRVLYANEFVKAARDVYALNAREGTVIDERDIREVTAASIIERIGGVEVDVLDGSPPCASFSTAGKREKKWGEVSKYSDTEQRVDDLFFEFARILDGLQPRTFVAENVSGLVKGVAKGYFLEVLAALKACGYRVGARVLDAQWLGVPQQRQRVIFVGVREDLGVDPAFPSPLPYRYGVREALPWIQDMNRKGHGWFDGGPKDVGKPADTVPATQGGAGYSGHEVVAAIHYGRADFKRDPNWSFPRGQVNRGDEPCGAVLAIPGVVNGVAGCEVEVVRTRGNRSAKETWRSGDEPSVAITAERPGPNRARISGGFIEVVRPRPQRVGLDEPFPTVIAGTKSSGPHQAFVKRIRRDETVDENTAASIEGYAIGEEWDRLSPGQKSKRYLNLTKPHPEEPSPTVTSGAGSYAPGSYAGVTHPTERRKFTIAELKRICAFPDDFKLTGTYAQQWERLGRAVPPVMMAHIAATVRDQVLARAPRRASAEAVQKKKAPSGRSGARKTPKRASKAPGPCAASSAPSA